MICHKCYGTGKEICTLCHGTGTVLDVSKEECVFDKMQMFCMYLEGINVCNNQSLKVRDVKNVWNI